MLLKNIIYLSIKYSRFPILLFVLFVTSYEIITNSLNYYHYNKKHLIKNNNIKIIKGQDSSSLLLYDISSTILSSIFIFTAGMHGFLECNIVNYNIFGISLFIASSLTYILKKIYPKLRPDESDYKSFPSGHTILVFISLCYFLLFTLNINLNFFSKLILIILFIFISLVVVFLRFLSFRHYPNDIVFSIIISFLIYFIINRIVNYIIIKYKLF